MPPNWAWFCPLLPSLFCHPVWRLRRVKRDTGSSQVHSFHFAEEQRGREGWSGQACGFGHRKLWILWRMEDVLWGDIVAPHPPTHHPKMTPDPLCVYIRPWKWEIVMSHSGSVFTLQSHARKEISHGLLKVARWERIAAVPQRCCDLPPRAWIYFTSSHLQGFSINRKQQC